MDSLACPACERHTGQIHTSGVFRRVECVACGCAGPVGSLPDSDDDNVIGMWNAMPRRTRPPPVAPRSISARLHLTATLSVFEGMWSWRADVATMQQFGGWDTPLERASGEAFTETVAIMNIAESVRPMFERARTKVGS